LTYYAGNPPLPWRERVGAMGIKMENLKILEYYHLHPSLPRRKREKIGVY